MIFSKNKVGRPKLPDNKKQRFSRIAIYPETHKLIKKRSKQQKLTIVEFLKKVIK